MKPKTYNGLKQLPTGPCAAHVGLGLKGKAGCIPCMTIPPPKHQCFAPVQHKRWQALLVRDAKSKRWAFAIFDATTGRAVCTESIDPGLEGAEGHSLVETRALVADALERFRRHG